MAQTEVKVKLDLPEGTDEPAIYGAGAGVQPYIGRCGIIEIGELMGTCPTCRLQAAGWFTLPGGPCSPRMKYCRGRFDQEDWSAKRKGTIRAGQCRFGESRHRQGCV